MESLYTHLLVLIQMEFCVLVEFCIWWLFRLLSSQLAAAGLANIPNLPISEIAAV